MFEYGSIVLKQVASMALMMMLGYFLYKKKMFDDTGVNQLSNLLVKVILPILVFVSFQRPYEAGVAKQLVISFLFAGISLAVAVIYAAVIYKGRKHGAQKAAATIFTNNGFMAFPLIEAIVGPEGIFLGAAYVSLGAALLWTYGLRLIRGKDSKISLKDILLNVGLLSTIAGVIMFFAQIRMPEVALMAMKSIGNANTPMAMLVMGAYLARTDLKSILKDKSVYLFVLSKMFVYPMIMIIIFTVFKVEPTVATIVLVAAAAPTGTALPIMEEINGKDTKYTSKLIAATTIASVIFLPVVLSVLEYLQVK